MVADEAGLKLSSELETAYSGPVKKSTQAASAVEGNQLHMNAILSLIHTYIHTYIALQMCSHQRFGSEAGGVEKLIETSFCPAYLQTETFNIWQTLYVCIILCIVVWGVGGSKTSPAAVLYLFCESLIFVHNI